MDWIGQWDRCGMMSWMSMDSPRTSIDQWIGLDSGINVFWVGCPWIVLGYPQTSGLDWTVG